MIGRLSRCTPAAASTRKHRSCIYLITHSNNGAPSTSSHYTEMDQPVSRWQPHLAYFRYNNRYHFNNHFRFFRYFRFFIHDFHIFEHISCGAVWRQSRVQFSRHIDESDAFKAPRQTAQRSLCMYSLPQYLHNTKICICTVLLAFYLYSVFMFATALSDRELV